MVYMITVQTLKGQNRFVHIDQDIALSISVKGKKRLFILYEILYDDVVDTVCTSKRAPATFY